MFWILSFLLSFVALHFQMKQMVWNVDPITLKMNSDVEPKLIMRDFIVIIIEEKWIALYDVSLAKRNKC